MKKHLFVLLVTMLCLNITNAQDKSYGSPGPSENYGLPSYGNIPRKLQPEAEFVPGIIITKLKAEWREAFSENLMYDPALETIYTENQFQFHRQLFPNHPEREKTKIDLSLLYELHFDAMCDVRYLCKQLMSTGKFEYAEPRYFSRPFATINKMEEKYDCEETLLPDFIPNDSLYLWQKEFLQKIHATEAWEIEQGDTSMVIAIVDTGVDYLHPDLIGNLAHNFSDPVNGIDDDGNGYIDDFSGWDCANNDNDPGIPVPNFDIHHGSWVAGCVAATTNNTIGIASPGFRCRFMPVKTCGDESDGTLSYGYEGIVYAADLGAKVINCSWGDFAGSRLAKDIIEYAVFDKDALIVCAAGNYASEYNLLPASYDFVMSVAATEMDDRKTSYSTYNHLVDISSPISPQFIRPGNLYYPDLTGTSFAAPVVSAAAALVRNHYPELNALQTAERIRVTADPIDSLNPGFEEKLGRGRLNILRALTETNLKSVRLTEIEITDNNDDVFYRGDTVFVWGKVVNYLDPATNLICTLSSPVSGITFLKNDLVVGQLNTLESKNNIDAPFSFIIDSAISFDVPLALRLEYNDGSYNDWQWIPTQQRIKRNYVDIQNDQIWISANSEGRFGVMYDGGEGNTGFHFLPIDSIEARMTAFMIGNSNTRVSDACYTDYPVFEKDFKIVEPIHKVLNSQDADQVFTCTFNDSLVLGPGRMGLEIQQQIYLWDTDRFLISEYHITNKSNRTYNSLFVGLNDEMDIGINSFDRNRCDEDSLLNLGYLSCTIGTKVVAGTQLLTDTPFNHYAYDFPDTHSGIDLKNGFSNPEKYLTLTTNKPKAGYEDEDGSDCNQVVSTGRLVLGPGESITVAFALLAGASLNDLQASAITARHRYDAFNTTTTYELNSASELNVFPNPANDEIHFSFEPKSNSIDGVIQVCDLNGRRILQKKFTGHDGSINVSYLPAGIYVLRMLNGAEIRLTTIVIQ